MNTKELIINWQELTDIWDNFVDDSPQGTVFAKTAFLTALGVSFQRITVYYRQKIVAGTVILFSEDGKTLRAPFPFTPYQGFLLADNYTKSADKSNLEEFLIVTWFIEQLAENFHRFSLAHSWQLQDLRPFQWYSYDTPEKGKFEIQLRYTGILKLNQFDNFDAYLNYIRCCRKQEMRKAIKNKLTIQSSEDIKTLDKLHNEVFIRQGIERTKTEINLLKSIAQTSLKKGFGRLKICYVGDTPASAILFLFDQKRGYYMVAGNEPEFRSSGASTYLLLDLIAECFEQGLKEVDFVGINSPKRGDFKLSFNAELMPYFITNLDTNYKK